MSYLSTPSETTADGAVAAHYDAERARRGYIPNYTKVFALRPKVLDAWAGLNGAIKSGMDLHRYEIITLAAARRLKSSYCSLAHGAELRARYYDTATVRRIATDHHDAGLAATDVAIMDFAEKVAGDASSITAVDVDTLRQHGLTDQDIFDVVLAAAARCFFSTVLDAVGAEPDVVYRSSVEPELQAVLTVGRAIATG
jgi:uncharacterized peroxidase-related enzyme